MGKRAKFLAQVTEVQPLVIAGKKHVPMSNDQMDKTQNKVAIVGLGYVGLPLSLQFARSGVEVLGLDIDPEKVESLNKGRSYIKHVSERLLVEQVNGRRLSASTDFARIQEVDAAIICVPTPLNKKPGARYFFHSANRARYCSVPPTRQAGCLGVDDLSGNHRRRFAGCSRGGVGIEGW